MQKTTLLAILLVVVSYAAYSQKSAGGFLYSGETFEDPDWGKSYKTSEDDRRVLSATHNKIKQALSRLEVESADYRFSVTDDMSHPFDAASQKEALAAGSKCGTCYFSMSPLSGNHLAYLYHLAMDLKEDSKTYEIKAKRDEQIAATLIRIANGKSAGAKEKELQSEMEAFQRETQKAAAGGAVSESELAVLEKKGMSLANRASASAGRQDSGRDYERILMAESDASVIKIAVETNLPFYGAAKKELQTMVTDRKNFVYRDLTIPGATVACIYFDKHQLNTELPICTNYTLFVYFGSMFEGKKNLPRPWVKPFCLRLTANGSPRQLEDIVKKIDFNKLAEVIK